MGDLTSFATSAIQALGVFGRQTARDRVDYSQERDMRNLQLQQQQEQAALEREKIRVDAQNAEAQRQAALRRAVARQRAQYGASGVSSGEGSARAVLLGLFDESEEELSQRTALDNLKSRAIDQGIAQQQRINTLQLTQLRQRDKVERTGNLIDKITSIF